MNNETNFDYDITSKMIRLTLIDKIHENIFLLLSLFKNHTCFFKHSLMVILFLTLSSQTQSQIVKKKFSHKTDSILYTEQLKTQNISIEFAESFYLPTLIALHNYSSQLKNIHIKFIYSKINTTMSCRPSFLNLIHGRRTYVISINNDKNFEGPLLHNTPFNAQIGVIAHELAHIIDYENKNIIELINTGIKYLNAETRSSFERNIDALTIANGYGWQLYEWASFIQHSNNITNSYKRYKQKHYLTPQDIKKIISEHPMYTDSL